MIHPFDESGIARGVDDIARYQNRPQSLLEMLRRSVDRWPGNEAVVEAGGERLTYPAFWNRAARTAGGLRAQGIQAGERVAIRLGNGADWCVAFFAIQMAGAVAVPVNTRFTESEIPANRCRRERAWWSKTWSRKISLPFFIPAALQASRKGL